MVSGSVVICVHCAQMQVIQSAIGSLHRAALLSTHLNEQGNEGEEGGKKRGREGEKKREREDDYTWGERGASVRFCENTAFLVRLPPPPPPKCYFQFPH